LAGNFDGAGLSWGIIQWNIKFGTLQELWTTMKSFSEQKFKACFDPNQYTSISHMLESSLSDQMAWALSTHTIEQRTNSKGAPYIHTSWNSGWENSFNSLAQVVDFQEIQKKSAIQKYHSPAWRALATERQLFPELFKEYDFWSYCGAFDLSVQQGGIGDPVAIGTYKIAAANNSFESQKDAMAFLFRYKADRAKSNYRADCFSRRMGVLTAQEYQADIANHTAKRQNINFALLSTTGNLPIQEL
jgi:hypothetical protein